MKNLPSSTLHPSRTKVSGDTLLACRGRAMAQPDQAAWSGPSGPRRTGPTPGPGLRFLVEPLGFLGLRICNDASTIGDVSPGVGAAQAAWPRLRPACAALGLRRHRPYTPQAAAGGAATNRAASALSLSSRRTRCNVRRGLKGRPTWQTPDPGR